MIIGISGRMGSGKSTAIEALKTLGRPVYVHKFAGPLYQIQEFIYRLIAPVYTPPEGFVKHRALLQFLGTDFGRDTISKTLWVDLWKKRAEHLQATAKSKGDDLIIVSDDTRFDNEAETIMSMGGYVIRIDRPESEDHAEGGTGIANHASEAGLRDDLIDYRITNEGTREEFQEAFRALIQKIESEQAA